jgi:hypothetical protein
VGGGAGVADSVGTGLGGGVGGFGTSRSGQPSTPAKSTASTAVLTLVRSCM